MRKYNRTMRPRNRPRQDSLILTLKIIHVKCEAYRYTYSSSSRCRNLHVHAEDDSMIRSIDMIMICLCIHHVYLLLTTHAHLLTAPKHYDCGSTSTPRGAECAVCRLGPSRSIQEFARRATEAALGRTGAVHLSSGEPGPARQPPRSGCTESLYLGHNTNHREERFVSLTRKL